MDIDKLITAGLSESQAKGYALLIERGEVYPPDIASELGVTRTNAYKIFDKLATLGVAQKIKDKKSTYRMNNPLGLATLAAQLRAEASSREEAINSMMNSLLASYYEHTEQPSIDVVSGKHAVAEAYRNQIALHEDIYFIRSKADIPAMGFETMDDIRTRPARFNLRRYGMLPDVTKGPVNYKSHERSNLDITWIKQEDYNAPVEWSITKSSLLIILFSNEPHAITIANPIIAGAFLQLWHLLNTTLKAMPYYATLPRTQ